MLFALNYEIQESINNLWLVKNTLHNISNNFYILKNFDNDLTSVPSMSGA